ncbi:MAG: ribosome assembly cofactor RimP [Treponema sp.]|nr:ribosome assembly cofactor RimP [Treponema sp.]
MRFTPRKTDVLFDLLHPVVSGLNMTLVETAVTRRKGSVHIKIVVYKDGVVGIDDCSRVHRAVVPRLDLVFLKEDFSVEVSSPGIERLFRDASEFALFIGRGVRCYRTDISDWTGGVLKSADETRIALENEQGMILLEYGVIAKAKLDKSYEVYSRE